MRCPRRPPPRVTQARTPQRLMYFVWRAMLQRCENPGVDSFKRYGARGIRVCDRWHSWPNFKADMAATYAAGLTLERIDNDGPYDVSNCRWATRAEQQTNTRRRKTVAMTMAST